MGTRGPAGRFGHQHIYNNLYEDFLYQAIHSRSDNQVCSALTLVEIMIAKKHRFLSRAMSSVVTPVKL
jgi:pectate lyase